jgi:hypothetical protein
MPPGKQVCPPCVCPLSISAKPACAACRQISGVCESKTTCSLPPRVARGVFELT